MTQKLVELSKGQKGLSMVINLEVADAREEIELIATDHHLDADSKLARVIEWQIENEGWELVPPEEVGALTSSPILSDEVVRNDQGNATRIGMVYWWPQYEVVDPVNKLLEDGIITFSPGEDGENRM